MPQLTRRRRGHEGRDDRGAVATIFAILLVFGVLLGLLALVIDVGQLYVEREELQTGADAAAVAVAKACSLDTDDCVDIGAIEAVAQQYANDNARDGVTHLREICGRLPGILQPCTDPASNLTGCLEGPDSPPPAPARYVEVRVHTEMSDGAFALPPAFAQTMAGNETFDGTQVGACARASWEPAEEVTVLALTISTCEFDTATNGGTDFAAPPPYPPNPSPSEEYTIAFPTPTDPTAGHSECGPNPPAPLWDRPGPAAWLDGNGSCEMTLPDDGEVTGSDSFVASPPASCRARIRQAINNRELVYVPVHDARAPGVLSTDFRVIAVAPVVFGGFHLGPDPADDEVSWVSGSVPCTDPSELCVSGLFVKPRIPIGSFHGDAIVSLIG